MNNTNTLTPLRKWYWVQNISAGPATLDDGRIALAGGLFSAIPGPQLQAVGQRLTVKPKQMVKITVELFTTKANRHPAFAVVADEKAEKLLDREDLQEVNIELEDLLQVARQRIVDLKAQVGALEAINRSLDEQVTGLAFELTALQIEHDKRVAERDALHTVSLMPSSPPTTTKEAPVAETLPSPAAGASRTKSKGQ